MKKVARVGILVADVIVQPVAKMPEKGALEKVDSITIHSGGNAMTASINLTKLGNEAYIIGKVGGDVFGNYLRECLVKAGVSDKGLKTDDSVQTSASVLMIDAAAERSFFHTVGTNGHGHIGKMPVYLHRFISYGAGGIGSACQTKTACFSAISTR